ETVEERARELVPVGGEPLSGPPALGGRIAAGAARTQVHRRHELKARRKHGPPLDPGDADHAVFERLTQSLERRTRELRKLVEKEDAAVREARLTGARPRPSADDRRRRGRMVGRPERRRGDERSPRRQKARNGVDARDLERLLAGERRQDPRKTAREHRLAGARRPTEQEV